MNKMQFRPAEHRHIKHPELCSGGIISVWCGSIYLIAQIPSLIWPKLRQVIHFDRFLIQFTTAGILFRRNTVEACVFS